MKALSALLLLAVLPLFSLAQTAAPKKPQASHAKHPAPTKVAAVNSAPAPAALTADELALSERVYVGHLPCELGAAVTVEADAKAPGYFHVHFGKNQFHMAPVATTTGAIRLEDRHAGTVWLQLANKSMLMNERLGKRLVDACMNPAQVQVAETLRQNPAPFILDDVVPQRPAAMALTQNRE